MADKKRRSSDRSFWNLFLLVPNLFSLVRSVLYKIKIKTYFTIKNVIVLLMLALMLGFLLAATWMSLLGILFFGLIKLQWTWYVAAMVVMLLNVLFLLILGFFIMRVRDSIAFSLE